MNDCKGKELKTGQEVVFSVGTKLLTGVVARVRTKNSKYYTEPRPVVKVTITPPEEIIKQRWVPVEGVDQEDFNIPWMQRNHLLREVTGHRHFREIYQEDRILILKDTE